MSSMLIAAAEFAAKCISENCKPEQMISFDAKKKTAD